MQGLDNFKTAAKETEGNSSLFPSCMKKISWMGKKIKRAALQEADTRSLINEMSTHLHKSTGTVASCNNQSYPRKIARTNTSLIDSAVICQQK